MLQIFAVMCFWFLVNYLYSDYAEFRLKRYGSIAVLLEQVSYNLLFVVLMLYFLIKENLVR
jgi:hypothetical protein